MNQDKLNEKISEIVKYIAEGKYNVSEDVDITEVFDSIQFVTLIIKLEEEFDIEIDSDDFEAEKFRSIKDIAELIETYLD